MTLVTAEPAQRGTRRCGGSTKSGQEHLIRVAPAPAFARLERLYDRVLGLVKMFGRVLVLR